MRGSPGGREGGREGGEGGGEGGREGGREELHWVGLKLLIYLVVVSQDPAQSLSVGVSLWYMREEK